MTYYPEGQSRAWFRLAQLLEKSQVAKLDSKTVPGNLCRRFWTQHSCVCECSSSCSLDRASETNITGSSQTLCCQELSKTPLRSSLLTCNTTCCFSAQCLLNSRNCCRYTEWQSNFVPLPQAFRSRFYLGTVNKGVSWKVGRAEKQTWKNMYKITPPFFSPFPLSSLPWFRFVKR